MPDPYEGSLQRDAERGTNTITFQVPGGRPDEICKGIDGKIAHVAANSHSVSAIQAFQTRSALEVTGLIEPADETWTKLLAAAGETTP